MKNNSKKMHFLMMKQKTIDREKLVYKKKKKNTYDFRIFSIIRTFGEDICIRW